MHLEPLTGHSNSILSLAFSPKSNLLVSGSTDEAVMLWDVRAARHLRSLPAHSDPVRGVDFTHDGTLVVSCSSDGLIRFWDTGTGQCLRTIIHEGHAPVTHIRFAPNGRYVLAWTLDDAIRLWNFREGRCVKTYAGHVNSGFKLVGCFGTYVRRGTGEAEAMVVSGSEDGRVVVWDVQSKVVRQEWEAHKGVVFGVDWCASGLLCSGGEDGWVKIWREEVKEEEVVGNGDGDVEMGEPDEVVVKKEEVDVEL